MLALPAGAVAAKDKDERVDGDDPERLPRRRPEPGDPGDQLPGGDRRRRDDLQRGREHELPRAGGAARQGDQARRSPTWSGSRRSRTGTIQSPSDLGGPPISPRAPSRRPTTVYDFLDLLMDRARLASTGSSASRQEFDRRAAGRRRRRSTSPGTVAGEDLDARLEMRDVILARKGVKTKSLKIGPLRDALRGRTSAGSPSPPTAAGSRPRRTSATRSSSSSTPTSRRSATPRSARRRRRSWSSRSARRPRSRSSSSATSTRAPPGGTTSGSRSSGTIRTTRSPSRCSKKAGFKDNGAMQSCCYPTEEFDDPNVEVHAHRRPRPHEARPEDRRRVRDRQRSRRDDAVGPLALGPRRGREHRGGSR